MNWVLATVLAICLWGCSPNPSQQKNSSGWMADNGKIKVLSTTNMISDLVVRIGGEYIDWEVLINGEMDPHSYELVKGDDEKISFAQIVFSHGLGLEHGASLRYRLEHHPRVIALGDKILESSPEQILYVEEQLDPHIWMDISLWARAVGPIVEAFSKKDSAHAEYYRQNGEKIFEEMMRVHEELKGKMRQVPSSKRYLVTSHDAFHYFARAYLGEEESWQNRCRAPEGLAPDGQLSTLDIQRIIDHLFRYRIPVIFPESNVSRDSLKKIVASCSSLGLKVKISDQNLYGDAMGSKASNADTYLKMIEHNISVLMKEWNHGE